MINIATLLLIWIGVGTWSGDCGVVLRASGYNEAVSTLLCDVFKAAEAVRKHANVTEELKDKIKVAVYGPSYGAQFTEDGRLSSGNRFISGTQYGRQTVCEYYNRSTRAIRVNGAFVENLFGTFVCVCTPAVTSRNETLCGVLHGERKRTWLGNFNGGRVGNALLQDVWQNVISKCTSDLKNHEDDMTRASKLYLALAAVRNQIPIRRAGEKLLYVLGDARDLRGCSGRDGKDICAAYEYALTKWGIPWVKNLHNLLPELFTQVDNTTETKIEHTVPSRPLAPGTPHSPQSPLSREVPMDEEGEPTVNEEPPGDVENAVAVRGSETQNRESAGEPLEETVKRSEGSPTSQRTDIPYLSTDIHKGGSSRAKPQ
ncbi:Variant surface glycoprotein [Trypanosoma congolense IL3000]|uniref:Variant surface glycoprotein n=1 Tax=Trypanosoma congolense (strain IL3000) TaxID=1068625 RepID=F9WDV1_TRYCI|nr:Variant surface glycoprotein [Trypanosoma congolense IL3000]